MVLEEEVVLVCYTANAAENVAFHEIFDVGAKAVNNVVVVPEVELRNLSVGSGEGLGGVPTDVVGDVVIVAFFAELLWEWVVAALAWVGDPGPWIERAVDTDAVVVNLVASAEPVKLVIEWLPSSGSTYITWNGVTACTLWTSFQRQAPL